MAPSQEELTKIAEAAERNLNTHEAKTGAHRTSPSDESGVSRRVENEFSGAQVKVGEELSTNASYNKRIPPEEGGELDARGRQTRGEHFEGVGGPEHKIAQQARDYGGSETFDATGKSQHDTGARSVRDTTVPYSKQGDILAAGEKAVESNVAHTIPRKEAYKGQDWYTPETVPGSISAEGYEAPASVTEASREAEGYTR
ncbi:hypothetical protein F5Y16DRAFT_361116 [Xylariaceae sp. FL0255]|nr:hypothetical protein F5Y16DRAFT_361116 [Xylariaceae sp. FL0255]